MAFTGHVGAPNPHFQCVACLQNLWDLRRRMRNPNSAPEVNIIGGLSYCKRCAYKQYSLTPNRAVAA
jgi:hypothetical protein